MSFTSSYCSRCPLTVFQHTTKWDLSAVSLRCDSTTQEILLNSLLRRYHTLSDHHFVLCMVQTFFPLVLDKPYCLLIVIEFSFLFVCLFCVYADVVVAIPLTAYNPMAAAAAAAAVVRGARISFFLHPTCLFSGNERSRPNVHFHYPSDLYIYCIRFPVHEKWLRYCGISFFCRLKSFSLSWVSRYQQPWADGRPVWNGQSGLNCQ